MEYIVTPKGFVEKANHSYAYLTKTLQVFLEYQRRLASIIQISVDQGTTEFAVLGTGETPELVEITLRRFSQKINFRRLNSGETNKENEVRLDCRLDAAAGEPTGIRVLSTLLEAGENNYE